MFDVIQVPKSHPDNVDRILVVKRTMSNTVGMELIVLKVCSTMYGEETRTFQVPAGLEHFTYGWRNGIGRVLVAKGRGWFPEYRDNIQ